ncbi:exonuclease SbcCD subunit D C-terminal domain-containing protein [Alcanivorax sp. 1008]|uniref:exonuclease SbcCD subunit D C-terminal domain-containing protein n=1 Tax=Alcanivorax sp. 1008 TaxID=2816853 RepID=UPI001DD258B5|nr:exonuclease SbcCD subunit D C-terminal domain-containing protein [Alcanivorax sp. 1008]MCC1497951.1 exonuclease SbcCD subunit D C-terminal domain-containing protein [Alcanivorax sp. 1008]
MKVLHTSDWHIGRSLYGRKRYEEFESFLDWLADEIERQEVNALIVAGDIFDTSAPSNRAQELYYRFLYKVAGSQCRHVVVVAGNHDSPSFLNAPKELLKALDVHVIGDGASEPEEEVLVLRDANSEAELIVCAVPYLRDRDIRTAEAGESVEDKDQKLIEGIKAHYRSVGQIALDKRSEAGKDVPIVGTGHLFAAGGKTIDGDGVRELYVGSLAHVGANIFPECFDYLALGHLHVPQLVGGSEVMRYSGSPLPMGFGEASQQKTICIVEFEGKEVNVVTTDIPEFQRLERIKGDWTAISSRIKELAVLDSNAWVEIIYDGGEVIGDLREQIDSATQETSIEVLRVKNNRIVDRILGQVHEEETLDDLNVNDVFERCLAAHSVPHDQREELVRAYQETLSAIYEEDVNAE